MTVDVDIPALEAWSNGLAKNEQVEVFGCRSCHSVFVGLPDSHVGFFDATTPRKTFTYNVPRKVKCPKCGALWHGGIGSTASHATEDVTRADIEASQWNWLLRK